MTPKHQELFDRALELMPWGTQTNAKRLLPGCEESMPPFIKRGDGCRMWDLDDKEYIDYRCALGPIILGYRYPEVEEAVRKQMENGILFSMASPLELETAEKISKMVPWIDQIRFMKTGADACTCATRLARSYTQRDHILTSGYHGYHDWFAFQWPNNGVPDALKQFIHEVSYGDVEAVERVFDEYGDQLAAAIVEPYDWEEVPGEAFLKTLRQKCDETGTVLIFDEILTGFRLAPGGAQEYYGITPDLVGFAKAMANGYPISAYAGKRHLMEQLNKTIITTTYAGETYSLAAANAVMDVMQSEPVHDHIQRMGQRLKDGMDEIIRETGIPGHTGGVPHMPLIKFDFKDDSKRQEMMNRFFVQLYKRGIFANHRWLISYSHQASDIDETLDKMRDSLKQIL
jgi:glutamate-1-semialdehyde aminotransferase